MELSDKGSPTSAATIPLGLNDYTTKAPNASSYDGRWINDNSDLIVAYDGGTKTISGFDLYKAAKHSVTPIEGLGASGTAVVPYAINNSDAVVGYYAGTAGATAFVWTPPPSGGMTKLLSDVTAFTPKGATIGSLNYGLGIANNGDIIAIGAPTGTPCKFAKTQATSCHVYLLVPAVTVTLTAKSKPVTVDASKGGELDIQATIENHGYGTIPAGRLTVKLFPSIVLKNPRKATLNVPVPSIAGQDHGASRMAVRPDPSGGRPRRQCHRRDEDLGTERLAGGWRSPR